MCSLAEKEFNRLRQEIQDDNVKIIVYRNKYAFVGAPGSSAYAYTEVPSIALLKNKGISYRKLITILLHEYAHIHDGRSNRESRRWKETDFDLDLGTVETIKNHPKKIKYYILKNEYIAESMVKKLLKKFKVQVEYSDKELQVELCRTLMVYKYFLINGKMPSGRVIDIWDASLINKPFEITEKYLKDFSKV
ncbi:MAG: hypothetical protein ABIK13_00350 [Patescibacteria group bacterium]